jgi:hypothetical protein
VNDFIARKEKNNFEKKMRKAMLTGIVVGVKGSDSYSIYRLPKGRTVGVLSGADLQSALLHVKSQLKKGYSILNTNI